MQYVLLIYQGTTPGAETLSQEVYKAIGAEYGAINKTPGVTPGLPLGLPEHATTVQIQDGETLTTDGPFVELNEAIGGYYLCGAGTHPGAGVYGTSGRLAARAALDAR